MSGSVTDAAQNALGTDYTWSFTTGTREWGPAILLETYSTYAAYPDVGIDAAGDATAVWWQDTGAGTAVGKRFGPSGIQATGPIGNAGASLYHLRVGADDAGNAIAVWANGGVWAARYVAGTGWTAAALIAPTGSDPAIAMDAAGDAFVVYGVNGEILARRFTLAGGWETALPVGTDPGYEQYPRVEIDADGEAVAVWFRNDGASARPLFASRYTNGTGWSAATQLSVGYAEFQFDLTVASNGDALLAYYKNGNAYALWYRVGTGWEPEVFMANDPGNAIHPHVAIDGAGNGYCVWWQGNGPVRLASRHYDPGTSTWEAAIPISSSFDGEPVVGIDGAGVITVAWPRFVAQGLTSIFASRYNGSWSVPIQIESVAAVASLMSLAVHPNGNAVLVFEKVHQDVFKDIHAITYH